MSQDCCASGGNTMILTCAGASNVGQLSNKAAVALTQEGYGKLFCLAGAGGHLGGFVKSVQDVTKMVAVDGCSVGCVKAILKHIDAPLKNYVVVTDLGIEKNGNLNLKAEEVETVKQAVKEASGREPVEDSLEGTGSCNCGGSC